MVISRGDADPATAAFGGQQHEFEAVLEHSEELNTLLKTLQFREVGGA